MSTTVDSYDVRRALRMQDATALADLCEHDPISTLRELDYATRGLKEVQTPWQWREEPVLKTEHMQWMREQDRLLRRRLGWAQRDVDLRILRDTYHAGDLYLILGAGVSMEAKMPDWQGLVLEMVNRALTRHERLAEQIRRTQMALIEGETYFLDHLDDTKIEQFIEEKIPLIPSQRTRLEAIRDNLEKESYDNQTLLDATQVIKEVLGVDFMQELRATLYVRTVYRTKVHPAIARMVRPKQDLPGTLTPRVWAVLTYNFDDLVERAVREAGYDFTIVVSKGGQRHLLSVGDRHAPSAVDIIHVHGFAPSQNSIEFFALPIDDIDLVFSADQYRVQYGADSSFVREFHGSFLVNAPALIIGSSLTDDYAVEELRRAHEARPGWFSYCLMQLPERWRESSMELRGEQLEQLSQRYLAMGLRVIWYSRHEEIPTILDEVREPPPTNPFISAETAHGQGNLEAEVQALQEAVRLGNFPRARIYLAMGYQELGDIDQAVDNYRAALRLRHREWSPKAALNLGLLLEQRGDLQGAKQAYREGFCFGEPQWKTRAGFALGNLLVKQGDLKNAELIYRDVIAFGREAAQDFALMQEQHADLYEAEQTDYEEAMRLGHEAASKLALL